MQYQKMALFHAMRPKDRDDDWAAYLNEIALLADLSAGIEPLAPNVWAMPDYPEIWVRFSAPAHLRGIETRMRRFALGTEWLSVSPCQ